jgi:hypothetical protein
MKLLKILSSIFSSNRPPKKVLDVMHKIAGIAFPRGNQQINEEAEIIYAILNKRVPVEDVKRILIRTKPLFYMENSSKSNVEIVDCSEVIRNSTKIPLSNNDIILINQFYSNYFGFQLGSIEKDLLKTNTQTNFPPQVEDFDLKIDLIDKNAKLWGSVQFIGDQMKWIGRGESGGGFYAVMLCMAISAARKNLSSDDKNKFSLWAGLPQGAWTDRHYSEFAFSWVIWLSEETNEIADNENLKKAQYFLNQSGECGSLVYDFCSDIRKLFLRATIENKQ